MSERALYWGGSNGSLAIVLHHAFDNALKAVKTLDDQLSGKTDDEVFQSLYQKFSVDAPVFDRDSIEVKVSEEDVDARAHPNRFLFGDNEDSPKTLRAHVAHLSIRFSGERDVMNYTPSSYSHVLPRGEIRKDRVHESFILLKADSAELDSTLDKYLENLLTAASNAKRDCDSHNEKLKEALPRLILERRNQLASSAERLKGSKYLT